MDKRFIDIIPGDKIYQVGKHQTLHENVDELTVYEIKKSGFGGPKFIMFSKDNNKFEFPIFKNEFEKSYIIMCSGIVATSLKTLKRAVFKNIAEHNRILTKN